MSETPKTLLIGDIATLIGTSPSTLRLWEEHGIVEPEKDERNQYRHYTADDSCRFLFARKYRSFGVPLPRVQELLESGADARGSALAERRTALDEEIRRLVAARAALDRYLEECRRADGLIGRLSAGEREAAYHLPCVEYGSVRIGQDAGTQEVLRHLPAVDFTVVLDTAQAGKEKSFTCRWGYGIGEEAMATLPDGVRSRSRFLPQRRCLLTAIDRKSARDFTEAEFQAILELLAGAGADLDGPVIGHLLGMGQVDSAPLYRILLFLPIKD